MSLPAGERLGRASLWMRFNPKSATYKVLPLTARPANTLKGPLTPADATAMTWQQLADGVMVEVGVLDGVCDSITVSVGEIVGVSVKTGVEDWSGVRLGVKVGVQVGLLVPIEAIGVGEEVTVAKGWK